MSAQHNIRGLSSSCHAHTLRVFDGVFVDFPTFTSSDIVGVWCQAPSFWSSSYESFGVHNATWFRVSCREVVGGAERSEAETTASRLAAKLLGVM